MQINTFYEHKKMQNPQKIHGSCGFEIYETFAYLTDFPVKLTLKDLAEIYWSTRSLEALAEYLSILKLFLQVNNKHSLREKCP